MGLDKFRNNSSDDDESDENLPSSVKRELKRNTPPGKSDRWVRHEPGNPGWEKSMIVEEKENVPLGDSDEETHGWIIKRDTSKADYIITDTVVELNEKL